MHLLVLQYKSASNEKLWKKVVAELLNKGDELYIMSILRPFGNCKVLQLL